MGTCASDPTLKDKIFLPITGDATGKLVFSLSVPALLSTYPDGRFEAAGSKIPE